MKENLTEAKVKQPREATEAAFVKVLFFFLKICMDSYKQHSYNLCFKDFIWEAL